MLVIKVWCLPKAPEKRLFELSKGFDRILAGFAKKLGFNKNRKCYLFPADMMETGLGEEILIEVSGLSQRPRTSKVLDDLQVFATELAVEVTRFYPKARVVSRLEPYDPDQVTWSNRS